MIDKAIKFLYHYESEYLYMDDMDIRKINENTFTFRDAEEDLCVCVIEGNRIKLGDEIYKEFEFYDLVSGGDEDGIINGILDLVKLDDTPIPIYIPNLTKVEFIDEEIEVIKEGLEEIMYNFNSPEKYEIISGLLEKLKLK